MIMKKVIIALKQNKFSTLYFIALKKKKKIKYVALKLIFKRKIFLTHSSTNEIYEKKKKKRNNYTIFQTDNKLFCFLKHRITNESRGLKFPLLKFTTAVCVHLKGLVSYSRPHRAI